MKQALEAVITAAVKDVCNVDIEVELTRPDEQFGDYATNVALQLAKQLEENPREIADKLAVYLRDLQGGTLQKVTVAGQGFLNLELKDEALLDSSNRASSYSSQVYKDKVVVAEYSDPNPFKVLHAGHLYTSVVGDAIANLLEQAGGQVHRVNFGGDVGLHVGRTMWAILNELGGENSDKLSEIPEAERSEWLAKNYIIGTNAYEEDETAKQKIIELNKRVYQVIDDSDYDSAFAKIYWTTRKWSYDYFDKFYARIGSKFEKYYPESQTAPLGLRAVREHVGSVYKESQGAVIFDGEKYGLHTRVFINSQGLPTYEAKEVGLSLKKWQDYHFDTSVIITGNDIIEYMKVVLKSIEQFEPKLAAATIHLTHGQVKLAGGAKMSSRKGNILRAVDVLSIAAKANKELTGDDNNETTLGAVKYAFLKNRIGGDIIYDPAESVSISGNSGPYLQYAHARARSILVKAASPVVSAAAEESLNFGRDTELEAAERSLARKIGEYPEAVDKAVVELMPHHICTYLYGLAQNFNSFYEHNRVVSDARQAIRLQLVQSYADVLKAGLELLNIPAPEHL